MGSLTLTPYLDAAEQAGVWMRCLDGATGSEVGAVPPVAEFNRSLERALVCPTRI